MNIYTLLMIIPVVLAVALIIMIVRRNITENSGRSIDIAPAIPAVVVLMIAILVIAPMAESTQDYIFDERTGELTINKNIPQLAVQPWDEYADEVKSLVIKDGVEIGSSVFDSLTSLEYLQIGEDVSFGSNVFGVDLKDYMDSDLTSTPAGEYVGAGDGSLYIADSSVLTFQDIYVMGLAASAPNAKVIVLPREHNGTVIDAVGAQAFNGNTTLEKVFSLPDSSMTRFNNGCFRSCTALEYCQLPDSLTTFGPGCFNGDALLTIPSFPETISGIGGTAFVGCNSLTSIELANTSSIGGSAFEGCTGIEKVHIGQGGSIGAFAFKGLTGLTEMSFGSSFGSTTLTANWTDSTFYESDGTTVIDKLDASALAGKTFQGTSSALVEVSAGTLSLTPQQLQQVQLHTQELQQQELDIQPMPFQPAVQTQDQEPVSA